jgi:3-hydroxyacyl-[acyl-carrier-protein] dehydratase
MRFNLVDRILEVRPGQSIRAVKNVTLGEEYLADHFPTFPVMPGVLMLHALVEAGAWLLRITDDFRHSVIVLREAKNVRYGSFLEPGRQMVLTAELAERDGDRATFKGRGEADGQQVVSARFSLGRYNLREHAAGLAETDERIVKHLRSLYNILRGDLEAVARGQGPA